MSTDPWEALREIVEATNYVPNADARDANRIARAALAARDAAVQDRYAMTPEAVRRTIADHDRALAAVQGKEPGQRAWEAYFRTLLPDMECNWHENGPGERNKTAWAAVETALASPVQEGWRAMLDELVNARALSNVRALVAGWNGEGREGGPFMRHPSRLGARIETNCGRIYELDEIMARARAMLDASPSPPETREDRT
jgi:hypothetical protein